MRTKGITKNSWTLFWQSLGIYVEKKSRTLKNYVPKKDVKRLLNVGVDKQLIESVLDEFNNGFTEPKLQFLRFSKFFLKDVDAAVAWTKSNNASDAYSVLFNKIKGGRNLASVKNNLNQLHLIHEYNRRGEGRYFEIKYTGRGSLNKLKSSIFSGYLSTKHEDASYISLSKFDFEGSTIIPILKKKGVQEVYKFIRLKKSGNKIEINIKADSSKEINLIKHKLSIYFRSFVDIPEETKSLDNLITFIKTGVSEHFTLVGATFLDNDFIISTYPKRGSDRNIITYSTYKNKFKSISAETIENIVNLRVLNKEINTRNQANIVFFTNYTDGLIGAVTFSLDDRGLNNMERKKMKTDFEIDFNLSLGRLIRHKEVSENDIYKVFLQNLTQKQRLVKLRTQKAIDLYRNLLKDKIIDKSFELQSEIGYCFFSECRMYYKPVINRKVCHACGSPIFKGKNVIVRAVNEAKVADYIGTKCENMDFEVTKFPRKLLKRSIVAVNVTSGNNSATFIPIAGYLSDDQLEILKFRYPDAILLTSKGNTTEMTLSTGLISENLHSFIPKLVEGRKNEIQSLLQRNTRSRRSRIVNLTDISAARISNIDFYKEKNNVSKNLGAELFEADCAILLEYIFGNSIWLGAKERGKPLPDALTAFPIHLTKHGCFATDLKFCESARVALGSEAKNKKYITDGRKNDSIKRNGGLKGFIFISNAHAPGNFKSKFDKLTKQFRGIKISFFEIPQLIAIFSHFKDNEAKISTNSSVKKIFLNAMSNIIFKKKPGTFSVIADTENINNILEEATSKYALAETPRVSS